MPEISAGHHYLSPSSSLDFAAPRIYAPGGFFFPEVRMSVESEIIWMGVLVQFAREHLAILGAR